MENVIESIRIDAKREKVAVVGENMNFTAERVAKFWPIYKGYEAEFTKVGDTFLGVIKDYAANYEIMTDDKASEFANELLRLQQVRPDLRKKYVGRLAKELSPMIAARFLQVDNRINLLIDLELASRVPLIMDAQ